VKGKSIVKILLDADSCPKEARKIVLKAAKRNNLRLIYAANRPIPTDGDNGYVVMEVCPATEGAADDRIVTLADAGDFAITRDLGLAQRLIIKGLIVMDDRGRMLTKENIGELLSLRLFKLDLVERGVSWNRNAQYGQKERKKFADSLDRALVRALREGEGGETPRKDKE
jgi:uncharacterized protein YaiI (UPF0178 family)